MWWATINLNRDSVLRFHSIRSLVAFVIFVVLLILWAREMCPCCWASLWKSVCDCKCVHWGRARARMRRVNTERERERVRHYVSTQRNYDLQVILFLILWLYVCVYFWYFVSRLYRILIGLRLENVYCCCYFIHFCLSHSFSAVCCCALGCCFDWFLLCLSFDIHALCTFVVVVAAQFFLFHSSFVHFHPFF